MISAEELRSVVDRLPVAVIVVDRALCIAYANAAARRLEYPGDLQEGRSLPSERFGPEFESMAQDIFEGIASFSTQTINANESTLEVYAYSSVDRALVTLFIQDVTRRSARDRAHTDFVANAAHELLTPLTGIVSAAHVLDAGAKEVPEIRDRFLAHIAREGGRLTRLARGLLVLARAQSGQERPRPVEVPLCALLNDIVDRSELAAMEVECADDILVFVDRDLVETALSNLVANALRHSSDGSVSVIARRKGGRRVDVLITNAGQELTDSDIERFGTRFASGGGADGGGFGLGISIATDALHATGATLTFQQDDGEIHALVRLPESA